MKDNEYRDYLTALYNRRWLFEQSPLKEGEDKVSLLFMDLDNFKAVNDLYGHEEGDAVLSTFGKILQENAKGGFPVRMSGDEFVLVLPGAREKEALQGIYETLDNAILEEARELPAMSVITLSAGIARDQDPAEGLQQIINRADNAMYAAKREGKRCCVFFEDIEEKALFEQDLADHAQEGLEKGQFHILFYPVLNIQNLMLEQTNIFVAWERENGEVISPKDYFGIMESTGFIRQLNLYFFEELCKNYDLNIHRASVNQDIRFSIHVSWLLLIERNIDKRLKEILDRYGVSADRIILAVDEASVSERESEAVIRSMNKLKKLGFSFNLIHFGKSFSSIRLFRELPVDTIAFDPNWLRDNLADEEGRKIVKSMIRLAKETGRRIHAIMLDDPKQVEYLSAYGCDGVQGTLYTEAMTFDEYKEFALKKMAMDASVVYRFRGNLEAEQEGYGGEMIGDGVAFSEGITDHWGSIRFPGGDIGRNVVNLPAKLFAKNSFTISLWVKPETVGNWSSVIYMRFLGGFISVVPYSNAEDGISVFRVSEDQNVGVWHDVTCRSIRTKEWSFLTATYDSGTQKSRYFINGRFAGVRNEVPTLIGCREVQLGGDPFQKPFDGEISALTIDCYAKTDAEISAQYKSFLSEPNFRGAIEEYWKD